MKTSIYVKNILKKISYIDFIGNVEDEVSEMISINPSNEKKNIISWCSDRNKELLKDINCGTYIVSKTINRHLFKKNCNYILVENPRLAFKNVLFSFFLEKEEINISDTAIISKSVKIGNNVSIGNYVTIEKNCSIGNNVIIKHNTVILKNTHIGDNVIIGSNNTIGGIGFGYEKNKKGNFELIPHIGNVVISDNVEIGNNTTIDRAVLGSTFLDENVKVDNLVHIAHGVKIGKNSVIIANSMIAGSVVIGSNSWIAPSSSVLNKKTIGDNSLIGLGAIVIRNVNDNEIVVGNPAKKIN